MGSPHRRFAPARPADVDPCPDRAIDLGSGAGFPGLVLALATGVPFDLIEADQRKAAFLREAARVTGAPVRVHAVRIESRRPLPAPLDHGARAGAAARSSWTWRRRFSPPGATACFSRAQTSEAELTHAAAQWHMQVERFPAAPPPTPASSGSANLSRVISQSLMPSCVEPPPARPGARSWRSPTRRAASARPRRRSTSPPRWPPTANGPADRPRSTGQRLHRPRHCPRRPRRRQLSR